MFDVSINDVFSNFIHCEIVWRESGVVVVVVDVEVVVAGVVIVVVVFSVDGR